MSAPHVPSAPSPPPTGSGEGAGSATRAGRGLAGLAVKRGVTFTMIYLIVAGFGLFSLSQLRLDMYPDVTFPMMGVITQYTGASPQDVEEMITRRIEEAVAAVKGVKKVSSDSKYGASVVLVEFEWGTDLDMRELDVRKSIGFIEAFLPEDAQEPLIFVFDPSMQPVIFMGVEGPFTQAELRQIGEQEIEPRLERLPGVASAFTMGGLKRQIQVRLRPERLQAFALSAQQVVAALRGENVTLPGGSLIQGQREFPVETQARFSSVEQIGEVVVGVKGQVPVYLRDVAEVLDTHEEATEMVRNNEKPGVMVMVRKQSDANTVQTVRAIRAALPELVEALPQGMRIIPIFDQAEIIQQSLGNLSDTALQAFVLTALVLLLFLLEIRTSLIVALSIPVSVLATFGAMNQSGVTLNIISMAGLALAIGMLVDNSIVVIENVFRHLEEGKGPWRAAIDGTAEVAMAITASTLTTMAVFAPVLFVPGIAGVMFRDMALTICFSLTISLLVALTLVPLAASRLLARRAARAADGKPRQRSKLVRSLLRGQDGLGAGYQVMLRWSLRHRAATLLIALGTLVVSGVMASRLSIDFMPKSDQAMIQIQIDAAVGSSLAEMDSIFQRVEAIVAEAVPERETMSVSFGKGQGLMAMFSEGQHSGILRIKLVPLEQRRRRQLTIEEDLRRRLGEIPGIRVTMLQPHLGSEEGDIVIELYGHDLATARTVGQGLVRLAKETPGTADVTFSLEEGTPEFRVVLDRHRLAALGLNAAGVASTISIMLQGTVASLYQDRGNEYDILVRAPRSFRSDVRNLEQLGLSTPTGKVVPLSSVARVETWLGPVGIKRQSQQRVAKVVMNVPGKDLGRVTAALEQRLSRELLPTGFSTHVAGTAEEMKTSFSYMFVALLVAVLLVYMVMASQFESLIHPFVIIFSVPLAAVGVILALVLTGSALSVTALIGVIMLCGIVVNNGIVLVDFINQQREKGMPLTEAIEFSGRVRLRPILMTACTTVLGMVPLALELGTGAEAWAPLARTVIGGLTASTLLTLIVVPVIYSLVEGARQRLRQALARRRGEVLAQSGA